ncbi:ATP-grasp domain-containing protein [Salinicoccus roseus]|uniref:ATP-grasp domain-containing protein n=1 Tax=Salinicoccus roseus TaxID=45670 RepID=UPI001EF5156F|nr:ATP-grasp domain-containing protein [Salinicoccus roseus]
MKDPQWLPELEGTVPEEAYGYAISIYSITYEAWRRGLDITFENVYLNKGRYEPRYSIASPERKIRFTHTRPNIVDKKAIRICSNKQLTRETLGNENIPVPRGFILEKSEPDQVKNNIKDLSFPLVIKPLEGHGGRGVITGIDTFNELMESITYLKEKLGYEQIIVEEFIGGEDYRVFVIGDEVVGAFRRLAPHVIGDGKQTIRQLLKEKNEIRIKIPGTFNLRIKIDEEVRRELKKQNLKLDSIPKKDQYVRLKTKNNVSSGGDPIDATEELTEDLKKNLIRAVNSIPGLIQGGVDVIYDKRSQNYAILEINTKPSIRNHLFPISGKAHEIPKAMIDYYFPETKGKYLSTTTPKYYFDYMVVKEHIQNNKLKNLTLPSHPYEPNLVGKLFTFTSSTNVINLRQMIRRYFHKFKFNGEMKRIDSNQYVLIFAGNYQDIKEFINLLKSRKSIENAYLEDYNEGIRLGFTFEDNYQEKSQISNSRRNSVRREKKFNTSNDDKKIKNYKKALSELEKEIEEIKRSKSWKITAPMRKLRKKLKK